MLVLSRKTNERIIIGNNIGITVVAIRGRHVRIGIEAPADISILREELARDLDAERSRRGEESTVQA
jgi:carbon storage regulator